MRLKLMGSRIIDGLAYNDEIIFRINPKLIHSFLLN